MANPEDKKVTHVIKLKSAAVREITDLRNSQPAIANQIQDKIDELKQNLYPAGTTKLKGSDNSYRVRSGDYRIVYEVVSGQVIVYIVRIAHRKSVYI